MSRKLLFSCLQVVVLYVTLVVSSCHPETRACRHISCENGGNCIDGICNCPTGYTGQRCESTRAFAPCDTAHCNPGFVCNNGKCECPEGYEGGSCEVLSRSKFIGTWHVMEKGTITLAAQYPVAITAGDTAAGQTGIRFTNFYNYFTTSIKGYVHADTIFVPQQEAEGKIVVGWGLFKTTGGMGSLSMRYQVKDIATSKVNDFGYDTVAYPLTDASIWNK